MSPLPEKTLRSIPNPVKDGVKKVWLGYARLTKDARPLPDYIVIGGQRCGTTSLYNYLVRHPSISRALTKEVRYFDFNYERGEAWYRSRFPSARYRDRLKRRTGADPVVGEATPDYLFHPHVPDRIARLVPMAKLIVILRNPVDRAYSHYWHQVTRGFEPLPFDEAVAQEPARLGGELERTLADPSYLSWPRHHHSYVTRGQYAEQLAWWFDRFPRESLLVVRSEDLYEDPDSVSRPIQAFLGVPGRDLGPLPKYGSYKSGTMSPQTRSALVEHFRPHNARLAEMVGRDFGWDV